MLIHTRQLVFHKEVRNKSKFISQIGICIFINAKSEIPEEKAVRWTNRTEFVIVRNE